MDGSDWRWTSSLLLSWEEERGCTNEADILKVSLIIL
jgi:hypothetical protein